MLVTKSRVKDYVSDKDLNCGKDFYEALNAEVERLVDNAARRAEDNDRRTVKARDA